MRGDRKSNGRMCGCVRLLLAAVWLAAMVMPAAAQTTAPATQPASQSINHEELLAAASRPPIYQPPLKKPDGSDLSDAERAELSKADSRMDVAIEAQSAGKHAEARDAAREAMEIRKRLLGERHHLTLSASVAASTAEKAAELPDDARRKFDAGIAARKQAKQLQDDGRFETALETARSAIEAISSAMGEDHVETGIARLRAGSILIDLGRLDEADTELSQARKNIEAVYGDAHPESARVYDRTGWLRIYQGSGGGDGARAKLTEAVSLLSQAVRIFQQTLGEGLDEAEALDNLGTALLYLGNAQESLNAKLRALHVRRTVLGPEHRDTGVSLSNLAWLYTRLGQMKPVVSLRRQALEIFEKALPKDHPYISLVRNDLANDLMNQNQPEEAARLLEDLVAQDEKGTRRLETDTVMRRRLLGEAYHRLKRYDDAKQRWREVYELALNMHEAGKTDQAHLVMTRLAAGYQLARMLDDMLPAQEKIVAWDNERRGEKDEPGYIQRAVRLGTLYRETGRYDEAMAALDAAAPRAEKLGQDAITEQVTALVQLARVYEAKNDLKNATRIADAATRTAEGKLGRRSGMTAFAMLWLGRMNSLAGYYDLANFSFDDADAILKAQGSEDLGAQLQVLQQRGEHNLRKGDMAEAQKVFREGLSVCRRVEERLKNVYVDASAVALLRGLIASTKSDSGASSERQEWQSEFKSRLLHLKEAHALNADEKAWLKEAEGS